MALDLILAGKNSIFNLNPDPQPQVHEEFANSSWYGWDHMMDQHLGIWYDGEEESCLDLASLVRDGLESAGISVGERQESDAHEMYSGYGGTISWEVVCRP